MAMLVGSWLGIRYNVPGRHLPLLRFVVGCVDEQLYPFDLVCRSPDGDSYEEPLSDRAAVAEVLIATGYDTIPNIAADQIYPFRADPTAAQIAEWKVIGDDIVAGRRPGRLRPIVVGVAQPRGHADLAQALGLAMQGAVVQAQVPNQVAAAVKLVHDLTPGSLQWVLAEAAGDLPYGARVQCPTALVKGSKIVYTIPNHGDVFLRCVAGESIKDFLLLPAERDMRILPTQFNLMGSPERSLQSAATTSRQEAVIWTLPGKVRTAPWCLAYLSTENLGLEGHHEKLRSLAGVDGAAWGIHENYQLMMTLKMALQVDQLDGSNCAVVENLFRRAQTIEFGWAERIRERENRVASNGSRLSI